MNLGTDLLFTPRCVFCQRILGAGEERKVCPFCHPQEWMIQPPFCRKCGRHVEEEGDLCPECLMRPNETVGTGLFRYEGTVREAILRFKYDNCRDYAGEFARLLWDYRGEWITHYAPELLLPVPVHKERLRQRGYNQAAELASALSDLCGIPMRELLIREKKTVAQKGLGLLQRAENIKGAFRAADGAAFPPKVLIVDDIYTTGATVKECADAVHRVSPGTEVRFIAMAL